MQICTKVMKLLVILILIYSVIPLLTLLHDRVTIFFISLCNKIQRKKNNKRKKKKRRKLINVTLFCAVMPKIILLMIIIFHCQGFPIQYDEINVNITTTPVNESFSDDMENVTFSQLTTILSEDKKPQLPTPAALITSETCPYLILQNITEINQKLTKIEKTIKKISSDMIWLRIANICSAVLSASCIAPVLVILCRLKLPPAI